MATDIRLNGSFQLDRTPDDAFPLFSPEGERAWAPGWDPALVFPRGVEWAEGQIFRAGGTLHDAVWIVARLDRDARRVTYYRVEERDLVARIDVACGASGGGTRVEVTYTFVALSPEGERAIDAMSHDDYAAKMRHWRELITR
jgi:hypothetical protein